MDNSVSLNPSAVYFMCPPPENQSRFQGLAAHFFAFVKGFFSFFWNLLVNLMTLLKLRRISTNKSRSETPLGGKAPLVRSFPR